MAYFHHRIKSGKKGNAVEHSSYNNRLGRFQDRDDLVHSGHGNLPTWAENNPIAFWRGADLYERANGAVYREHEIALPNELSVEQNRILAERLVEELVGAKTYEFAVHAPKGKLSGISNPHLHLMFSDRLPDGIERSAERMFSRYNAAYPEDGGCRKDSGGRTALELRDEVIATRKQIADIQNQMLAEFGFEARVDHRSLRERRKPGRPERYLGQARVKQMSEADRATFVGHRRQGAVPPQECSRV